MLANLSHSQSRQKRVWIIIRHAISIVVNLYLLIQLQAVVVAAAAAAVVGVLCPNCAAVAPRHPFFQAPVVVAVVAGVVEMM
jgi:hypothetical protein